MSKGTGNVNGAVSGERDDWKLPVNFSTSTNQTDVLHSCCNINLWVPLCGEPDVFVGHPTSRGYVS